MFVLGNQIHLRLLREEDAFDLLVLAKENRKYWSTYEPSMSEDYYTLDAQVHRLRHARYAYQQAKEYHFGIFKRETDRLIGQISLYDVKRLPFMKASLGYSLSEKETKKGYMTEAITLICRYGYRKLQLRRIEAYVSPKNLGSIRVLEKNGFQREGLMRDYLYIHREWEDHYLYSLLATDM